jgi:hypothetical protein
MLSTLVKLVVVAVVVAVIVDSLPDIKRYREMRDMLAPHESSR